MSVNERFGLVSENASIVAFQADLDMIYEQAITVSGVSNISRVIRTLRTIDQSYIQAAERWAELIDIRTPEEHTAIGAIKFALDDLVIAFADGLMVMTVPAVIDIGAGYGGTREEKLSEVNRNFPFKDLTLPASITNKATALVQAIDAYRAL